MAKKKQLRNDGRVKRLAEGKTEKSFSVTLGKDHTVDVDLVVVRTERGTRDTHCSITCLRDVSKRNTATYTYVSTWARQNPIDEYNRALGMTIAFSRALREMTGALAKESRAVLWRAYWSTYPKTPSLKSEQVNRCSKCGTVLNR